MVNIIKYTQKGGLEPMITVPKFKYTFNEERKLFIGYVYPYSPYLISCITTIPFTSYSYKGNTEYINIENNTQNIIECSSTGSPVYFMSGGAVYEILNKKFTNIKLHDYCDATGDIDVTLYPPKLTTNFEGEVNFFNVEGKITSFYSNFTTWIFQNMVKNINSIQKLFDNVTGFVNFNIEDYQDIPSRHKNSDFGYNVQMLGKLCVVAFLNDDGTMFKIQVVCKIEESSISSIDHVIEIIVPLPESDIEFCPSGDAYQIPKFNTIEFSNQKYNVQSYNKLIDDNINAYLERKNAYGASNERNVIHKSINHIARLFYLYELFYVNYNNALKFEINNLAFLFLFGRKKKEISELQFLYYYKIVDSNFHTIKVDTRFFLNSYLQLIVKNQYIYNNFKNQNPTYFINDKNLTEIEDTHNRFNTELFNDDLFQPSGILTFSEISGGKKSKKTRKSNKLNKRNTKKRNTKKKKY
jgi:hypothetical protein